MQLRDPTRFARLDMCRLRPKNCDLANVHSMASLTNAARQYPVYYRRNSQYIPRHEPRVNLICVRVLFEKHQSFQTMSAPSNIASGRKTFAQQTDAPAALIYHSLDA